MKKKNSLIFGLGIIVGLTISFFLNGSTVIGFPFAGSDIEKIEMYHYEGVPAEEQCKIITEQEDIDTLYKEFQNIKVRDKKKDTEPMTGGSVTRFVFVLSDGNEYDLDYYNPGSSPSLISKAGNFEYQTSANLEKYWITFDYELVEKEPENDEIIETEQTETNEFIYQIENPSWEYYCSNAVAEVENISFELEQVYEVKNDITDLEVWQASNEITLPQFPYSDEYYFYTFTGDHFYEATGLMIYGKNHSYNIDMNSFTMTPDKVYEANDSFMTNNRGYVNFAKIKDGILYVSTGHKGYSVNNPSTGYITAIDLVNGEVLWKSAPQVSNAYNFEIIGDVIICGYGFTDEDDFLYVLNRTNGQVMEQIPLKSMAEYIVAKGSTLYVRTYNRNYEFSIKRPPKTIYEGCYFDGGVYQYWGDIPLTESPMIYCEIWISNVTETTFDFLIKEVVMATDERTIVLPLSTAKITNNGWGAIYEGEEFTLTFEFPDDPDRFPKEITVDGWEKLEGNTYMNKEIPGHESG